MTDSFIFVFSEEGFECIVNLSKIDEKYVLAKLADEKLPTSVGHIVHMMEIRARYNQERKMEVWALQATDGITEDDLWAWAKTDPQDLAEKLRDRGVSVFSTYSKNKIIV